MLVRGQVPLVLYLSLYNFYLSRTIGQSLMSSPVIMYAQSNTDHKVKPRSHLAEYFIRLFTKEINSAI